MTNGWRHVQIAALIIGAACAVEAAGRTDADANRPAMAVAVHDYAHVPQAVLRDAEANVASLFRDAGVDVVWVDPLARRTTVRVHILSKAMRARVRPADNVLGLATLHSAMVYVLYDRVTAKAEELNLPLSPLLACVMAHEIGHLLLPGRGHAAAGLMSAVLRRDALTRTPLRFDAHERRLFRAAELLHRR